MHQREIEGIPVLWQDTPGPWSASLIFGVGTRHETFRTVGVTHLVEHLVMSALPKSHLDRNANVALDTTTFFASGRIASVAEFLSSVCSAVADPPLDRIATEAGVLSAEGGFAEHPAVCAALGARYGATGPGLAGTDGPGPQSLSREHVVEHLGRHFVRGNAVLVATGEPPPDLRLSLPEGRRVGALAPRLASLRLPGRLTWDAPMTSFSLMTDGRNPAWPALMRIMVDRLTDELRHGQGLAYDVDFSGAWLDHDSAVFAIWADGRDGEQTAVAEGLWRGIRLMAAEGPTEGELAHDRAGLEESISDPRQNLSRLENNAWRLLTGRPVQSDDDARAALASLEPRRMAEMLAGVLPTVLAHLPEGCAADLDGLPDRDMEPRRDVPVTGRVFSRRLATTAPLRLHVTAGDDGLTLRLSDDLVTVRWDEVVGLGIDGAARHVVAADGRTLPIFPSDLRNGRDLVTLIDSRVPDTLRFDAVDLT